LLVENAHGSELQTCDAEGDSTTTGFGSMLSQEIFLKIYFEIEQERETEI